MNIDIDHLASYIGNLGFPIVIALILLLRVEKTLSKVCGSIAVLTLAVLRGDRNKVAEVERLAGYNIYGEKNGCPRKGEKGGRY